MMAIVLDTNAIHRDPWLTNGPSSDPLTRAADGSCVLILPTVVIEELRRQKREAVRKQANEASNSVDEISDAGARVEDIAARVVETFEWLDNSVDASFDNLVARPGVLTASIPEDRTASLVERDLLRRRPFVEVGVQSWSTGFRDAVIWETVLEVLGRVPNFERVVFVTADKGFLTDDSASLHQDLLDDLGARGIALDRLVSVKTTFNARSEVDNFVAVAAAKAVPANSPAPLARLATLAAAKAASHAAFVTIATNALFELVGKDVSLQMVYGGEYDYPDFVKFTLPGMESGYVADIDQTTEFEFVEERGVVTASARAWISIEGATSKGDWFADAGESVNMIGEINDHYFETSSEVAVVALVEIDLGGELPEAVSVVLEDDPSASDSAAVGDADPS